MILNFEQMQAEKIDHFRDGEKHITMRKFTDADNTILLAELVPGASIGLHRHIGNSETMYFLEGSGKVLFEGEEMRVFPGICHYCPQNMEHTLINDGNEPLKFFAVIPKH